MPVLYSDLRFALRSLQRGGAAIFVALATLVVALATATAIFTVAQAILFATVPAVDPDEVVGLARRMADDPRGPMPVPTFFDWLQRNRTLGSLGAYSETMGFNLEGSPPQRLAGVAVSADFFSTLGIRPKQGSAFGVLADEPGAPSLAVISHSLWIRRFGGTDDIIGRSLLLDGDSWEIVAVMPAEFRYPHRDIDLWLPMGALHQRLQWENRSMASLYAVGRRQAGVSIEQVRLDLERVTETIAADTGVPQEARPLVMPLEEEILGSLRSSLQVLAGAVFLVLLIACANVANLLLARGFGRGEEVAVRMAFGARRREIVRLMLVESVTLACTACLLALLLAGPLARQIATWIPNSGVVTDDLGLNPGVFVFGLVLALVSGLAFGLPPAIRHSREKPANALRQGRRAVVAGSRMQSAMVVSQVAVASALLVAAGLMLRSLNTLLSVDPGFDLDGVLVQRIDPSPQRYQQIEDWLSLTASLVEGADAIAGVRRTAVSLSLPLAGNTHLSRVAAPHLPMRPDALPLCHSLTISEGFFDVIGLELLAGRGFTHEDDLSHPRVAIIDEGLAEFLWPGEDPLGRRIALEVRFPQGGYREGAQVEPLWREVIGLAPQIRMDSLRRPPLLQAYMPVRQLPIHFQTSLPGFYLLSETHGEPLAAAAAVEAMAGDLDPSIPVHGSQTLESTIYTQVAQERLLSSLLSAFGFLALLLSAAGVYSVQARSVTQRTREMGLRLALGAAPGRLLWQVVWRGGRLALFGAALGLCASILLSRVLESQLYGIGRLDLLTFFITPSVLLVAAFAASLVPAWRASRIDPYDSLRYE